MQLAELVNLESDEDKLFLQNVFSGKIVSGKIYPLIFNDESARSISFYKKVLESPKMFNELDPTNKLLSGVGIRDLFLAEEKKLLPKAEQNIFYRLMDLRLEFDVISINHLSVSHFPFNNHKLLKYADKNLIDDPELLQYFAHTPSGHIIFFVDPSELSYHNIENIIQVDHLVSPLVIKIKKKEYKHRVFRGYLDGDGWSDGNTFDFVCRHQIYNVPHNSVNRGGKRAIVQSQKMSDDLTFAIKNCDEIPNKIKKNFIFVNSVFRINRFLPDDKKFDPHYDTPYYDPTRGHISKYTLIIYLTSGSGPKDTGCLAFEDFHFKKFCEDDIIIMPQNMDHTGYPYVSGEKIFIRTELIYQEKKNLEHDPDIATLFNQAIYLTRESIFREEIAKYENNLYNHINCLHFKLEPGVSHVPVYFLRRYNGVEFITNGSHYIFNQMMDLKKCALLAVLDFLNCKIDNRSISQSTESEIIKDNKTIPDTKLKINNDIFKTVNLFENYDELDWNEETCCPLHCHEEPRNFKPVRSNPVRGVYNEMLKKCEKPGGYTFAILGKDVFIDIDKIIIENGKIYICSADRLPRINFAACWYPAPEMCVKMGRADLYNAILPPITFITHGRKHQLHLEFFKNDFMIDIDKKSAPCPIIID